MLVGFDFPYGYPVGTTRQLGFVEGEPWRLMWDELRNLVEDQPDNQNNRFEVAAELNGAMTTGPAPLRSLSSPMSGGRSNSPSIPTRSARQLR